MATSSSVEGKAATIITVANLLDLNSNLDLMVGERFSKRI